MNLLLWASMVIQSFFDNIMDDFELCDSYKKNSFEKKKRCKSLKKITRIT